MRLFECVLTGSLEQYNLSLHTVLMQRQLAPQPLIFSHLAMGILESFNT